MNKPQLKTLEQFINRWGGVAASSDWTNGSGRYITRKQPPVFCRLMEASDAAGLPGVIGERVRKLLKRRPRVQKVVACVDIRSARRAMRGAGCEVVR